MILETIGLFVGVVIILALYYKLWFLRDPERDIPKKGIICPADGKVVMIKKFEKNKIKIDKKFLGQVKTFTSDVCETGYIVSIFMNVFNVHINRAPISGVVKYVEHKSGKFLNASKLESTFENENVQILIHQGQKKIKVIQIAGLIARRIVPFVKSGQKITRGQRIGLIKLGSQVTIIMPDKPKVKVGDKVYAGKTILA